MRLNPASAAQPEPGLRIEFPDGADVYWATLRQTDREFVVDTERRERRLRWELGVGQSARGTESCVGDEHQFQSAELR